MKLLICSDLHLEFPQQMGTNTLPPIPDSGDYDLVIAAGDIGYAMESVKRLRKLFPDKRVLFVPGNHEYYKSSYGDIVQQYREASDDHVTILNPGTVEIDGYTFIGATMWSDLNLAGYQPLSNAYVEQAISDFRLIGGWTADDMVAINQADTIYVANRLEERYNDKTVVITHFVPTQDCIHDRFVGHFLNPYFTNDHDYFMEEYTYPLHIFGHTHDRYDQIHSSGTRLVSNPRGYPNENPEPFQWKIVEI